MLTSRKNIILYHKIINWFSSLCVIKLSYIRRAIKTRSSRIRDSMNWRKLLESLLVCCLKNGSEKGALFYTLFCQNCLRQTRRFFREMPSTAFSKIAFCIHSAYVHVCGHARRRIGSDVALSDPSEIVFEPSCLAMVACVLIRNSTFDLHLLPRIYDLESRMQMHNDTKVTMSKFYL